MPLKVGDRVIRESEICNDIGDRGRNGRRATKMEGTVTYIHPFGWYHIVEFKTRGGKFKESFWGVEG